MKKLWKKLLAITAVSLTISLAGLVRSDTVLAQIQCQNNLNGTVTDYTTGLMWQKQTAGRMIWKLAMSHASGLSLGGHSDWRLPMMLELHGLYNSRCKTFVSVENDWYWSADLAYPSIPWRFNFNDGSQNYLTIEGDFHYVIAVRKIQ